MRLPQLLLPLLFAVAMQPCIAAPAVCKNPLRLNVGDWAPYTMRLPDGGAAGIDVDIVLRMAKAAGCRVTYTFVPPERAHPMLKAGEIDILMAASDLPERRLYAWFSRPYRQEVMAVLAAPSQGNSPLPSGLAALLAGHDTLLAPRFGWYGKDWERARPQLAGKGRLALYDDYLQGVAMLKAGRAPLLLGDEQALRVAASSEGVVLRRLFVTNHSPVHLMFSRTTFSAADARQLDAALASALAAKR